MNSQTVETSREYKLQYLQSIQSNPAGKPHTEHLKAATFEVKSSGMSSCMPRKEFLHKTLERRNKFVKKKSLKKIACKYIETCISSPESYNT